MKVTCRLCVRWSSGDSARATPPPPPRAHQPHRRGAGGGGAEARVKGADAWARGEHLSAQLAGLAFRAARSDANSAPVSGCSLRTSTNSAPAASVSTGSKISRPSGMRSVAHGGAASSGGIATRCELQKHTALASVRGGRGGRTGARVVWNLAPTQRSDGHKNAAPTFSTQRAEHERRAARGAGARGVRVRARERERARAHRVVSQHARWRRCCPALTRCGVRAQARRRRRRRRLRRARRRRHGAPERAVPCFRAPTQPAALSPLRAAPPLPREPAALRCACTPGAGA